ncbi:MAG: hypothetical protein F6K36_25800 [Symploca sp. SIO3C6]|uniref:DUF11 domain-containing protein n=1 Tax=Symploca sp. SIO1C4 TaxID=2607765 RepID=A0A6B3NBQ5_9CYAN|nr:hypothetical protein [Symploca sp. SIO3C6]NER28022.1 hypothetical protein [Symploca sp. SIO1C4]
MKRLHKILGLGALTVALAVPFVSNTPVWAQLELAGEAIAENLQREEQIKLVLSAEKKVIEIDKKGQSKITWQQISGKRVKVIPNDVIRYTLNGENVSDRAVKNLVVNQPIPQQTKYVLGSATVAQNTGAETTYSIDSGNSFVKNPVIKVTLADGTVEERPAPAEAYTHIRWNFGDAVNSGVALNATYEVEVR